MTRSADHRYALSQIGLLCLLLVICGRVGWSAELRAYPERIELRHAADTHRLLVVRLDEASQVDMTDTASMQSRDPSIATVVAGRVYPHAVGNTQLDISSGDLRTTLTVDVTGYDQAAPVNFALDIVPIFTKAGCNSGACHGASRGQDGFRLSLFGFDAAGDYFRVTREMGTRRINLADPAESLLLQKATGTVTHTGGKRMELDSVTYQQLHRWLSEGAHDADTDTPTVESLQLYPDELVLRGDGETHRLLVTAQLSDGSSRDVTDLAQFNTTDPSVATIDAAGNVTAKARGEAFITCRYDVHTLGATTFVLPTEDNYSPAEIGGNYIDKLVGAKLEKLRLAPSPICSDAEYLRRLMIDTRGRLPSPAELDAFLVDNNSEKRAVIAKQFIEASEFDDLWTAYWSDILMVRPSRIIEKKPAYYFHRWLVDQIAARRPIDDVIYQLLTAKGSTFEHPEANFFAAEPNRQKVAENVAQAFLGIRVQCAQCHNHPFDRWTMDDYYGFAAFFQRIARKRAEDYREWIVFRSNASIRHPVTKEVVKPKFLGDIEPEEPAGSDRLQLVADWLVAPDNPYFTKNIANRVWAHFFGRGIVHPIDDVRISNPPSNPELYEAVAEKLLAYDFDVRRLALDIVTSQAYQRSTEHPDDAMLQRDFGRASYRRLPANVLLDCISQVTESAGKFAGIEPGEPSVKLPIEADRNYFLKSFGQSPRTSVCACESTTEPTLSQALHLLNGENTNGKIKNGKVVSQLLKEGLTPQEICIELYRRCLSRGPKAEEQAALLALIEDSSDAQGAIEDIFWALLNSREFVFNH